MIHFFHDPGTRIMLLFSSYVLFLLLIEFERTLAFLLTSSPTQLVMISHKSVPHVIMSHDTRSIITVLKATSSDDLKKSSKKKQTSAKRARKNEDKNETTTSTALTDPFDGIGRLTRAIAKVTNDVKKREQKNVLNRNDYKQPIPLSPGQQMYYSSLTNKFSKKKTTNSKEEGSETDISSLAKLTRLLDEKLYTIGPRGLQGDYPPLYGVVQNARDNMISLLNYNQVTAESTQKRNNELNSTTYQVVIVFGKHLVRDQITLEYATRIKSLIQMLLDDISFKPSLICFCGAGGPGNVLSAADAGYLYFRHLIENHHIDLQGSSFFLESSADNDDDAIVRVTDQVKNIYLPKWIMNTPVFSETTDPLDENTRRLKKVMIHFTLLSTDYHLCNINDVHHRSPRQSLFKAIESIDDDMKKTKVYQRELFDFNSKNTGNLVYTSWSYQYATYPYLYAKDDVIVFLGKCFLLGEELMPLLANMKGVVEQKEFFQRDNYLMLASIRRSLVSLLESLYTDSQLQIGLQTHLRHKNIYKSDGSQKDFQASLEGALLSLGRCVDVVRPAGLLLGSVSINDWAKALRALEHTMSELRNLCDPDRPLKQSEWFDAVLDTRQDETRSRTSKYITD